MNKISIVIPSFNQGKFIERTLQSLIQQNYENLEIIVIDGGSIDETINIVKKYESKISYWVSEKDSGQTAAINKGFKIATGDIIGYLNSDDIHLPGSLNKINKLFQFYNEIDVIYGNGIWIDDNDKVIRKRLNIPFHHNTWLYGMADPFQPEVFYRKRVLDKAGLLDENFFMMMDREWWIRMSNSDCKFLYVNDEFAALRKYGETKSARYQKINDEERWRLHDKYWKGFKFKHILLHKIHWKIYNLFYLTIRKFRVIYFHFIKKISLLKRVKNQFLF